MADTAPIVPDDIISVARDRFKKAQAYYSQSRVQAVADTRFAMGDSDNGWQWPDDIRSGRAASQKVILTVNLTAQHCNQIINNIRQNRPASKVSPVDDYADKRTAEILEGLLRNIKTASCADEAHDIASEHAIYGGEGYWRIRLDYERPDSFDQEIIIDALTNPNLVYVDCFARRPDRMDAEWGFIFEDISKDEFKREYPDIDPASWGETLPTDGWVQAETVRRAEYYWCEYADDTLCMMTDQKTAFKSELDSPKNSARSQALNDDGEPIERPTVRKTWYWCILVGGHDQPVDKKRWPGEYLPIVTVVGKELNVDGEIVRKGIVRDLKDSARMVNYAYSETVQTLAMQNKIPYLIAEEAIGKNKGVWESANLENYSYLPWKAYGEDGQPNPKPERQAGATMATAQVQLLQLSTEQMRAASGQQNANFGIKSEASSGVGIQRLKAQGEIATFHFPDNLSRALRYEDVVLIDLIQKTYDTARVVRVIGMDGSADQARLDPDLDVPFHQLQGEQDAISKIFNPSLGRYDVSIDTGPSYQTQRQEGADRLIEMTSRNPQIMQVAGDIVMRAQDFPMSDELADRLEKTIPPQLIGDKNSNIPPQAQAMITQLQQQVQQADQVIQQLHGALTQAQSEEQAVQAKLQLEAGKNQLLAQKNQIEVGKAQLNYQAHQEKQQAESERSMGKHQAAFGMETIKQASEDRRVSGDSDVRLQIAQMQQDTAFAQQDTQKQIADLTQMVALMIAHIDPPQPLTSEVGEDLNDNESSEA